MEGKKFWEFKAAGNAGELYLYGDISSTTWWGDEVTPQTFKQELDALGPIGELHVYVNSNGGDVFAGHAMRTMLKRHPSRKIMHVDGLAASIASVILTAGDEVHMPRNTMQMIHNAWVMTAGNSGQLRKMADDLDKINESLIEAYMSRCTCSREELMSMMDAETWLTAEECMQIGLCTLVEESKAVAASIQGDHLNVNGREFDLSRFRTRPKVEITAEDNAPSAQLASQSPLVQVNNAGRVLSAENEEHIRAAHDALGKVLDKLGTAEEDPEEPSEQPAAKTDDGANGEPPAAPEANEPDDRSKTVAYLHTLKAQIQTKRLR